MNVIDLYFCNCSFYFLFIWCLKMNGICFEMFWFIGVWIVEVLCLKLYVYDVKEWGRGDMSIVCMMFEYRESIVCCWLELGDMNLV